MIKALASLMLWLYFCLPGWAAKNDASLDANAIAEEIRNAIRDLQIQIPELLKDIRINVQIPDLELQIPVTFRCTTEKYLGCKQRLHGAVNDRIGIEPASSLAKHQVGHGALVVLEEFDLGLHHLGETDHSPAPSELIHPPSQYQAKAQHLVQSHITQRVHRTPAEHVLASGMRSLAGDAATVSD